MKVCAIFGFCDIRQFTDATEVLQEDVMEFVNSIAKIVHMETSLHGGFPNKNIGDAFLLVRFVQTSCPRHSDIQCLHGAVHQHCKQPMSTASFQTDVICRTMKLIWSRVP